MVQTSCQWVRLHSQDNSQHRRDFYQFQRHLEFQANVGAALEDYLAAHYLDQSLPADPWLVVVR